MASKIFYVYITTNESRTLYTGVTADLERRMSQHRWKLLPGFTSRYNVAKLVYYEHTSDIRAAIAREKQMKGWTRAKKVALIESVNPTWQDLSLAWFTPVPPCPKSQPDSLP
ncbi:MAG: GIY-YIG nuclease family protein [Chloroflexota bacterium]